MICPPTREEVVAALERVTSSPCFARALRAQSFLRFVTHETLAGRATDVRGYSIAIAVFRKPASFDATHDPLVRVEAGRLRSKLCEYYATVGAEDPVRIELRSGSYVPTFRSAVPAPTSPPASTPLQVHVGRNRARAAWALGVPAAALIAAWSVSGMQPVLHAFGIGDAGRAAAPITRPQAAPRIRVQPFRSIGAPDMAYLALGITEEVMTRLGAYPELQIIAAPAADADWSGYASKPGVEFLLSGSVNTADDTIRVVPQLTDARSGRRVWLANYQEPLAADNVWNVVDAVAKAVAAAVGEPYGPLFDAEVARAAAATPPAPDPYHCLLRFVFALQVISEAAHGRATACFEGVVAADPGSSMGWARLAALYRMEYLHGFNAKADAPPPLDRATHAAGEALSIDANNPFANQELAFLHLLRGDRIAFEDYVARTLALNPSADIRAALGINFVKMGQVERGLSLIDRSIADSPRAPPFFYMGYVVQALRVHDYDAAYSSAQRMATRDWPFGQAVLAAVAALAGQPEKAREAAKRLRDLQPAFAATGRDLIARGRLGHDVESQLAAGLALAGVPLN
jgi:adenylate cyclase